LLLLFPYVFFAAALPERNGTQVPAGKGSYAVKELPAAPSRTANSGATFSTHIGGSRDLQPARVAVDAAGNTYVSGTDFRPRRPSPNGVGLTSDVFLTKLDPFGQEIFTLYFGGDGNDRANGVAVDQVGNVYIVGSTDSDNFPRVNALQANRRSALFADAFLCKLTPHGGFIYATYLGGDREDEALAVAADAAGNAYVTGSTGSENFPVSEGAFQTTADPPNSIGRPSDAFVAKINANGSRLVYSTRLGGKRVTCIGGSRCVPAASYEAGSAIALDASGNAYVGGWTNSFDFPTTPGAFQPQCACNFFSSDGFVSKLSPDGAQLVFSTYLGGPGVFDNVFGEAVSGLAVSATGQVFVTGTTGSRSFPTTPGSLQPGLKDPNSAIGSPVLFVTKLNSLGSALAYSTLLSGTPSESSGGIAIDSAGNAYVTGSTEADDFPVTAGAFDRGGDFFAKLNATGTQLVFSTLLPSGFAGRDVTLDADGNIELLGPSGFVSRTDGQTMKLPAILGVANAAGGAVTGLVAPREIITIHGNDIGPAQPTSLQLDEEGKVARTLAGTRVLFDGMAAPLTFAQQDQINAVVPSGVRPFQSSTKMEILRDEVVIAEIYLTPVSAVPEIFVSEASSGAVAHAAALNQDGTINSRQNPAPAGSVVAIFATGLGPTSPPSDDGEIPTQLSTLEFPITVTTLTSQAFEVFYAGQAPGLVAGAMQINFRVGDVLSSDNTLLLTLGVGDLQTEFAIWSTP
jgi:uncharacterized protein (TIGR03437 family)